MQTIQFRAKIQAKNRIQIPMRLLSPWVKGTRVLVTLEVIPPPEENSKKIEE